MTSAVAKAEVLRLSEQERLDRQKNAEERNRWGQFATPPQLALDIARYALGLWPRRPQMPIRFLDPAVGTGSFFSAPRPPFPEKPLGFAPRARPHPGFPATSPRAWQGPR